MTYLDEEDARVSGDGTPDKDGAAMGRDAGAQDAHV
jgi:hypothetical protein